ncbi:MAG: aminotransferase class I/II-fold pyridoxal phosphate-dependent enzyme, partial [Candidatus Latescibacteria bacterium]|nr:aminotransferase class I/II-fold pyridoxal phosphate-dependent enzyme [Candidatus Latescibacterota bacterium]
MDDNKPVLSRRNFLMNAIAAAGVLTLADRLALAEEMAAGKALTINDIHSAGLPPGIIRMSSNENPLGPSPKAMEAVEKYKWNSNRYSWYEQDEKGIPKSLSTRATLNDALAKANGITLPAPYKRESSYDRQDNPFLVTSGSGRILDLLALTYLVPDGGEIIEAEYGYGDFIEKAEDFAEKGFATRAIKIPMTKDHGHDLKAMLNAVTPETRLMVITNPNNPT